MSGHNPATPNTTALRWLQFAISDLNAAKQLLDQPDVLPSVSGFHAQQAAEKALKAVLFAYNVDFPKSHDLVLLRRLLPTGAFAFASDRELQELTEWAVEARYPSDIFEASNDEAKRAVNQAQAIVDEATRICNA